MRAHGQIKYSMFVLLIVTLITARNNVASAQPTGTLRFKSGFESPVEIVYTSSNGQTQRLGYGDIADYSWSNLNHFFNYVEVGAYPDDVDTYISTAKAHSGRRSLYQEVTHVYGTLRNQLVVKCNDGDASNPETLDYMSKMYTSTWIYYPSGFTIDLGGWLVIFSYREFSSPNYSNVLLIYRNSEHLYWHAYGVHYTSPHRHYYSKSNYDVEVPIGRWFHLETYIERHKSNGVFRVWVDGVSVFNFTNVRTTMGASSHFINLAKLYSTSVTSKELPLYHWVDDIEIWDGMPSQSGASTYLDDGFEDRTFNAWTANISNSGSSIDIATDQTYDSSNCSAKVTGVDAVNDYALLYKTLSRRREYYLRAYFMIDTLPDNGTEANIAIRLKDQTNGWYLGELYLRNYNMTLQAGLYYYHNGVQIIQWTSKTYSTNTWYCVEVHVKCGRGDGEVQLSWNEELLFNQTSLNNNGNVERAYVGVGMWRGNSFSLGAAWFDRVKLDSAYIGAEANATVRLASTYFSAEWIGEEPLPNVKINGTHLTDEAGHYEWANLAYNRVYTFIVEKPAGYYLAWVLNVEGSYNWNGTHYILRHNVTETQTDPIEIYFSPTDEVYIKSATHMLTSAFYNSSSILKTFMNFKITAEIGVTSQIEIYTADKGHPRPFKIEGATDWSYDSESEILTVWMLHTSEEEAEIEWRGAAMGQ